MMRIKERVATDGVILMNMILTPNFSDEFTQVFDNTFHTVFTNNTSRQIIGQMNPWQSVGTSNIIYAFYNYGNSGRVYTINKTPVIYDR
jgi:hypothetical protein